MNNVRNFTLRYYREMIQKALDRFTPRFFTEKRLEKGEIIWRHDVDFSPNRALEIAKLDSDFGMKSVFFFRLRADTYSVLEESTINRIRRIKELNHQVGLHFERNDWQDKRQSLEESLLEEKQLFYRITGIVPTCVSWHNPTSFLLTFKNIQVSGMINAYSNCFFIPSNYVSDSGGYWKYKSLEEILADKEISKLQVLTHPEWWHKNPYPARAMILRALLGRAASNYNSYKDQLKESRKKDGGWKFLNRPS